VKVPGLKIVFGTGALAGMHGRNAEEFIHHVRDGGVDPKAAMISADSLAAEALDGEHCTTKCTAIWSWRALPRHASALETPWKTLKR
jgi:hypothetical protein